MWTGARAQAAWGDAGGGAHGTRYTRGRSRGAAEQLDEVAAANTRAPASAAMELASLVGIQLKKVVRPAAGGVQVAPEATLAAKLWAGRAAVVVVLRRPG